MLYNSVPPHFEIFASVSMLYHTIFHTDTRLYDGPKHEMRQGNLQSNRTFDHNNRHTAIRIRVVQVRGASRATLVYVHPIRAEAPPE